MAKFTNEQLAAMARPASLTEEQNWRMQRMRLKTHCQITH